MDAAADGGVWRPVAVPGTAGVGSRLGAPVGQLLQRMVAPGEGAAASQVLCITHLPQVGGHAAAVGKLGALGQPAESRRLAPAATALGQGLTTCCCNLLHAAAQFPGFAALHGER